MPRKTYTPEFKQQAVKMMLEHNYTLPQAAMALNVSKYTLKEWKEQLAPPPPPCPDNAPPEQLQAEIERLRRELARKQMECDILKKAAIYLAGPNP